MMVRRWWIRLMIVGLILGIGVFAAYRLYRWYRNSGTGSNNYIVEWLTDPASHEVLKSEAFSRCPNAPFILPTEGFIGLLWNDASAPYSFTSRHTGLDIFGYGTVGTIPIYAVYEGWLTRHEDWRSTVIIRHDDPLQAGRTIWTYYTHMASYDGDTSYIHKAFPAGIYSVFVEQGTLLGYQGLYNPPFPIAMHLHMSIVMTAEDGSFKNEAVLANTLDPSPYFGLELDADRSTSRPVECVE
jgi:peptidoglycan LD-endopeptidase LytH